MANDESWPPSPDNYHPPTTDPGNQKQPPIKFLPTILTMWGLTGGYIGFQAAGFSAFAQLCGIVSFFIAIFLVTCDSKISKVNGGLRLVLVVIGVLVRLLS